MQPGLSGPVPCFLLACITKLSAGQDWPILTRNHGSPMKLLSLAPLAVLFIQVAVNPQLQKPTGSIEGRHP